MLTAVLIKAAFNHWSHRLHHQVMARVMTHPPTLRFLLPTSHQTLKEVAKLVDRCRILDNSLEVDYPSNLIGQLLEPVESTLMVRMEVREVERHRLMDWSPHRYHRVLVRVRTNLDILAIRVTLLLVANNDPISLDVS